ncbi:MAG: cobaltochelatase subunit CobN, partial [Muribaculaceae bacterium]|nr:cobaltochelatase subunit CobN [Muribaculaceae bacterium]
MVFVNGMGLRITDEQRQLLVKAASKGTPVLTTAATNPQNLVVSVDSVDAEFLKQYLAGGSKSNYRSMLNYVRRYIDGKSIFTREISDPTVASASLLYHPDPQHPADDHLQFPSVDAYEHFLEANGMLKKGAPAIILTGQMGVPDSLISALERSGNNVYPVNSIQWLIRNGHADSIAPAAVINMAHGRMGDMVKSYLDKHNIPLFSPVNVNRDYDEWMADKMGMNGGFLSQSIVTPEIDGAIRPFALFAHYEGADGLPYIRAIPDRLPEFVETVNNYISLRKTANKDKRVAVFYFKGPGQNALVAEGMEVAPSLYNLLVAMRDAGYNLNGLPSSPEVLAKMINEQGKVFGNYAVGAKNDFIANQHPQIVEREDYAQWLRASMPASMLNDINAVDGPFPGHGLQTDNGQAAIARLQFGNVVLIPQTAAGVGDDDFKIVHGTDMAPPHNYVAAYLWARHGFGADALIHFGAHGSLEFTPRKQAALSSRDWPDRLIGTTPHFYIWATSNVGEAMMAKRRSYAGIINYLTPPFMESSLRDTYKKLSDAIAGYNREAFRDNPDENAVKDAALRVKKHTVEMGIHRDLKLDSILSQPYSDSDIARIESFAEELANEKITGALYVMGQPYSHRHIASTVLAMTVDPIAYSLYKLDRASGKAPFAKDKNPGEFTRRYVVPARALAEKLLSSGTAIS